MAVDGAQAAAMERWGYLRAEMGAPAITTTATTTDCMAVSSRAITATIATSEDKHRETEKERERETNTVVTTYHAPIGTRSNVSPHPSR